MFIRRNKALQNTAIAAILAAALALPGIAGAADSGSADGQAPIREIAGKLGAQVRWDQATHTVTVTKDGIKLLLTVGQSSAVLNGSPVQLGEPLRIEHNQTLVSPELLAKWLANPALLSEVTNTADSFLTAVSAGNAEQAVQYLSPALKQSVPDAQWATLWTAYAQAYGAPEALVSKTTNRNAVHDNYTYTYQTNLTRLSYTIRVNRSGEVDDLYIEQANPSVYQAPSYDNPDAYTEEEITLGSGSLALPGTLTIPSNGDGPFPALVLVHGSGTNDRDETIGGGKPFRDLAVGLASQGIAVLRYDKVTYEHMLKSAADPEFTLTKETVNDAISAVEYLRGRSDIDASHIFAAGHSQGGFAMPLIVQADQDHSIKGTIILSGPSEPFVDILVEQQEEQIKRLKSLGQDTTANEAVMSQMQAIAAMVNDPQYSTDNLPANFPLAPAYWWFQQRDYNPVELAKTQSGPMLVLQGENDCQVPAIQLDGWKNGLANRTDVQYKSYPKVTHLLSEYDGVSTGAEYAQPNHVSEAIVNDIATWVLATK
ncbi:stalk domain-containing protein [Cohnella lubricantis]|uniref:Prolyl oligopeptidase family serine peptidase n=1 Tax=Cohnella lubricantis TaxID=2163172 RepID=A0A841TKI5_9BACL|nr:stalk domain-containing protein [Cohnella lubricantis]MBB6679457.1 prolyl oligopeptidase family serine peptidase [Cohnella lubricantis]MBP2118194.1 dienelactone hydrolase [Cohnella lubricantis]